MRRLVALIATVMLVLTAAPAIAASIAWSGAGGNDFFDWGAQSSLSPEGSFQASPRAISSNLARTGTISDAAGFTQLVEGLDWLGDFTPGDNVLFTGDANDPFAASSAFTVNLNTAVAAIGLKITSNLFGAFSASLEVFSGATSLGVFNVSGVMNGNEDGTAPFLGALSDAVNINRAVFTLTSNVGAGLGVNRLQTSDTPGGRQVPEPATLGLLGLGALGVILRRPLRR